MHTHASAEFLDLCQSQIALLTRGLGASLCVVYLAEGVAENLEPQLVPVATYPETETGWQPIRSSQLLPASPVGSPNLESEFNNSAAIDLEMATDLARQGVTLFSANTHANSRSPWLPKPENDRTLALTSSPATSNPLQPAVIPLVYGNEMVGLLVTGRSDRPWTDHEHLQLEHIARALAIACLLDQRSHLLSSIFQRQHQLKGQQADLFDNLLHQFRNPLTALKTFGKLLLRRLLPTDPNRDVAASIVQESNRLQDLLVQFEQAIDLDHQGYADLVFHVNQQVPDRSGNPSPVLDRNTMPPSLQPSAMPLLLPADGILATDSLALSPCFINDIVSSSLTSAAAIASDRQLSLEVELSPDLPPATANLAALREIISNLLDNALKYTPPGGTVTVQTWYAPSIAPQAIAPQAVATQPDPLPSCQPTIAIAISDTGPGIPPQDLNYLFERHYRGVQAATDIPGTGLGLAIARDLAARMHGEIQVFSPALVAPATSLDNQKPPGSQQGATFILWLRPA